MRKVFFLLPVAALLWAFKADNFVKIKVTENITVSLPSGFVSLSQEQINARQLSARKPLLFYTDQNYEVDFTVNMSYSLWAKNDLEMLKNFYRSTIFNLYSDVNFTQEDIVEINGRRFVQFEFESTVRDDEESFLIKGDVRKYTLILYTILDNNNTVLVSFTCPLKRKDTWQSTAHEIMGRVKVK